MQEVKWIPLRLNNLPIVDMQINKVVEEFGMVRNQILNGDILAIQTLVNLKQDIKRRVQQIDKFYSTHCLDPRVKYIFAGRSLLARLAADTHDYSKINEVEVEVPWKNEEIRGDVSVSVSPRISNNPKFKSNSKLPPKTITNPKSVIQSSVKPSLTPNKLNSERQRLKTIQNDPAPKSTSFYQQPPSVQKKTTTTPIPISKTPDFKDPKVSPGKVKTGKKLQYMNVGGHKKPAKKSQAIMQLQQQKKTRMALLNKNEDIRKSYKDLSALVFTIKMSQQQYEEFIRLKRQNHHA